MRVCRSTVVTQYHIEDTCQAFSRHNICRTRHKTIHTGIVAITEKIVIIDVDNTFGCVVEQFARV